MIQSGMIASWRDAEKRGISKPKRVPGATRFATLIEAHQLAPKAK